MPSRGREILRATASKIFVIHIARVAEILSRLATKLSVIHIVEGTAWCQDIHTLVFDFFTLIMVDLWYE
jgi:hypothetical protein